MGGAGGAPPSAVKTFFGIGMGGGGGAPPSTVKFAPVPGEGDAGRASRFARSKPTIPKPATSTAKTLSFLRFVIAPPCPNLKSAGAASHAHWSRRIFRWRVVAIGFGDIGHDPEHQSRDVVCGSTASAIGVRLKSRRGQSSGAVRFVVPERLVPKIEVRDSWRRIGTLGSVVSAVRSIGQLWRCVLS